MTTSAWGYVDAHHHLWTLTEHPQTWMDPQRMATINHDFSADELFAAAAPAGVTSSVVIQSVNDAEETRHLLARAQDFPFVAGVVGWADLTSPGLADQIAGWRAGPGGERLVGLRHLVHDEPDPQWLDRAAVRRGLVTLAQAGLTFDLLVRTPQLPSALRVAQALPGLRLVVDHLAKPPVAHGALTEWRAALRAIAHQPNVSAKISGLVTEADWQTWTLSDLAPAIDVALEAFGPQRLMFGSDWPVCLLSAPYHGVVEATEKLLAGLSADERNSVFRRTAQDFYRL